MDEAISIEFVERLKNLHSLDPGAICYDLVDFQVITKVLFSKVDWHDERELGYNSAHSDVVKELILLLQTQAFIAC